MKTKLKRKKKKKRKTKKKNTGLPERMGLYVRQPALHPEDVGVRRRRRLSGQLRRDAELHETDVRARSLPVLVGALRARVVPLRRRRGLRLGRRLRREGLRQRHLRRHPAHLRQRTVRSNSNIFH